jgi:hypothetical protein
MSFDDVDYGCALAAGDAVASNRSSSIAQPTARHAGEDVADSSQPRRLRDNAREGDLDNAGSRRPAAHFQPD